jgi:DNA-directed RNA polymerase specialized sigma24 family protein
LRLQLHDVDDAEHFVSAIASRSGLTLSFHDRQELEQELLVECWRLSERFQPGGVSFSTYAGSTLRLRVVDFVRKRNGRTKWQFKDRVYERPRVEVVSLDDDSGERRMGEALGAWGGDPAAGGDPVFGGLAATGDRQRARDLRTLGLRPPRRAR